MHHFSTIDTQAGVYRTRYNQYDSIAVPLMKWLRGHGVEIRFDTAVNDLSFLAGGPQITVDAIACTESGAERKIPVGGDDGAGRRGLTSPGAPDASSWPIAAPSRPGSRPHRPYRTGDGHPPGTRGARTTSR
jgi:hypothetical protein